MSGRGRRNPLRRTYGGVDVLDPLQELADDRSSARSAVSLHRTVIDVAGAGNGPLGVLPVPGNPATRFQRIPILQCPNEG